MPLFCAVLVPFFSAFSSGKGSEGRKDRTYWGGSRSIFSRGLFALEYDVGLSKETMGRWKEDGGGPPCWIEVEEEVGVSSRLEVGGDACKSKRKLSDNFRELLTLNFLFLLGESGGKVETSDFLLESGNCNFLNLKRTALNIIPFAKSMMEAAAICWVSSSARFIIEN